MRREHTLTIRMIGRMTIFGSWTYWIYVMHKKGTNPLYFQWEIWIKEKCIERDGNDLGMEWRGMDQR